MRKSGSTFDSRRVSCIINPHAANKKWQRNKLLRHYIQKHLPGRFIDTQKDKENTVRIAKEISQESDIIVAAGGDGTIADVIQGIIESDNAKDIALGIIPLGSGNAISISLGIYFSIPRAIKVIKDNHSREIDLIDFGGRVATFGSIGAAACIFRAYISELLIEPKSTLRQKRSSFEEKISRYSIMENYWASGIILN